MSGTQEPSVEQVRVRVLPDGRLSSHNASLYLGHSDKTLATWRTQGKGPPWIKVSGRVFYFRDGLDRYIRRGDAA